MLASTWPTFGPLILLPTLITANTAGFAVHLERRHRTFALVVGCLAVAVPLGLEVTGLTGPSYAFSETGMMVASQALDVTNGPATLLFLCVITLATIITSVIVVSRVKNALRDAERRMYIYAWHLREFIPRAARAQTDPTVTRVLLAHQRP